MYFSFILLLVFILNLGCKSPQQTSPGDVYGWNGAVWGMSAEELLKIFPSSRSVAIPMRQMPGTIEAVIIEDFVEDGMHYNITFHVDSSTRRLVRIYQTHNGGDKLAAFDQLETRLKESYGSPSDVTNTDGNSLQAIDWNFPTTQIQLLYTNLVGEYTFVIYELAKRIRTEK